MAVQRNTIVCLGTGIGKTFIGVHLLKELSHQVRSTIGKWTVFLLTDRSLLSEQARIISMHTDLLVGTYGDDTDVHIRSSVYWQTELITRSVLVMTPHVFLAALQEHCILPSCINLVIFDDCHLAVGSHPYVGIMRFFDEAKLPEMQYPRILGLTASLLATDELRTPTALDCSLRELASVLHCTVETASDAIIADLYGTRPTESVHRCDAYVDTTGLVERIVTMLRSALEFIELIDVSPTPISSDNNCSQSGYPLGNEHIQQSDVKKAPDSNDESVYDKMGSSAKDVLPETFQERLRISENTLQSEDLSGTSKSDGDLVAGCENHAGSRSNICRSEDSEMTGETKMDDGQSCDANNEEQDIVVRKDPRSGARLVLTECIHVLNDLGPWCVARLAQVFIKQLAKVEAIEEDSMTQMFIQMSSTLLRVIQRLVDDQFDYEVQCLEDFRRYMTPKVIELVEILHQHKPDDNFVIVGSKGFDDSDGVGDTSDDDSMDEGGAASDDGNLFTNEPWATASRATGGTGKNGSQSQYVATKRNGQPEEPHAVAAIATPSTTTAEEDGMCGIVFVERRHVAFILNKLIVELCNWDADLFHVRSFYMAGGGTNAARWKEGEAVKQEETMRKFRSREINLVISTSVLEEGIDVPKCNLVIRFNPPTSYRSYIQSKGRARASKSKFCLLVDDGIYDKFSENLQTFSGIENILLCLCHNHDDYSKEDFRSLMPDEPLPSYSTSKDGTMGSVVTLNSAIKLVNRYCAKLPSDTFTHLTPKCYVEQVALDGQSSTQPMYIAKLQLPINSPIKMPITGTSMPSRRLAQMSTALAACGFLHRAGELDNNLQPVGKDLIKYDDEECEWEDHELHGQARPGTTKRKQYYEKRIARPLIGRVRANQPAFMYDFGMKLKCAISDEQNTRGRTIHAPEDTRQSFGVVSQREIPQVPSFPVFTRSGEVTVSLEPISRDVCLTKEELDQLTKFHRFLFCHILRLEKAPMIFDPDKAKSSCLIVPLDKDTNGKMVIDWLFVERIEHANLTPTKRKALPSRDPGTIVSSSKDSSATVADMPFVFREEMFTDAVVMPSYRNVDQPQYFYVAEIRRDLNPRSPFPSPELYDTFEHYYTTKYGLRVTNLDQPLLDVDHTSARLNLLTPRYMNQKGVALPTSSVETRRAKRENLQQKQILIPELCDVHPFPASLWRKAVCVPAILYRINYLLVANELRLQIASEADIVALKRQIDDVHIFPPLRFGFCSGNSGRNEIGACVSFCGMCNKSCDGRIVSHCRSNIVATCNDGTVSFVDNTTSATCQLSSDNYDVSNNILNTSNSDNRQSRDEANEHGDQKCERFNANNTRFTAGLNMNNHKCNTLCNSSLINNGYAQNDSKLRECATNSNHDNISYSSSMNSSDVCCDKDNQLASTAVTRQECMDGIQQQQVKNELVKNEHHKNENLRELVAPVNSNGPNTGSYEDHEVSSSVSCNCGRVKQDGVSSISFSLDADSTVGPSPCDIVQTLTMSNANDFFNLERLETIGDSFLKFAITVYLYCTYPGIHEGKLSYMRSIQVSNYNLYRLGKKKGLPECMVAVKFEPMENWLPPGYTVRSDTSLATESCSNNTAPVNADNHDIPSGTSVTDDDDNFIAWTSEQQRQFTRDLEECIPPDDESVSNGVSKIIIPYNLQTQHSLPDKSIADCVEALIGCYLSTCGQRAALLFMAWLGLKVLPPTFLPLPKTHPSAIDLERDEFEGRKPNDFCDEEACLPVTLSPLLTHVADAPVMLEHYLNGYEAFEESIQYRFHDRSYLLQAFTHASYHYNTITDCYQRLEFLGDAILDYVVTRHLFEDSTKHSPGVLTDLRSALVNNNIFATLAVQWNFHKYFKAISPQLFNVIDKFISWQAARGPELFLDTEESDGEEDIEIPKALGDIFESVAGAIYLDSGMSLDTVWTVYYRMMKPHIDAFMEKIPRSPVRELLEMEPETAKFEKPERTIDGKIRVTVNVVGKGSFRGVGRNYRIAKSAAAKRALKQIKLACNTQAHTCSD